MDWDTYGFVKASKYRTDIILALNEKPKTPSDIANEFEYHVSHVSTTLSELAENDLVVCLTENRSKGRIYDLTEEGEQIADQLNV